MSGPTLLYPIASGLLSKKPVPGINDPALVLASEYDRDTQALRDDYNEACADAMQVAGKLQAVEAERDALRAQVEVMRVALEVAALAMWNSEANMDNEAAAAEEALADAAMQAKP